MPRSEILDLLFVIDKRAIDIWSASITFDDLLRALKDDQTMISTTKNVLHKALDASLIDFVPAFVEFVIDVERRSILKSVMEYSQLNVSRGTLSFRGNVQADMNV